MATQTIVAPETVDAFPEVESLGEDGWDRLELFDGELVSRPMAKETHDVVKNVVGKRLDRFFETFPGYVAMVETSFRLDQAIVFTPDISAVSADRIGRSNTFAKGSPYIAFEVISSDTAENLHFKIVSYLEYGSKAVCCIYPTLRCITVFTPGPWTEFKGSASLEFPDLLPGFSMPLEAIFGQN
jgi:Uma2 family endonuclease